MNIQEQLIALATDLRLVDIHGSVVDDKYIAPEGCDPESLELALIIAGWQWINPGRYYPGFTPAIYRDAHSGVYHKGNVEARVCWGAITRTKPPSISLHSKPEQPDGLVA